MAQVLFSHDTPKRVLLRKRGATETKKTISRMYSLVGGGTIFTNDVACLLIRVGRSPLLVTTFRSCCSKKMALSDTVHDGDIHFLFKKGQGAKSVLC